MFAPAGVGEVTRRVEQQFCPSTCSSMNNSSSLTTVGSGQSREPPEVTARGSSGVEVCMVFWAEFWLSFNAQVTAGRVSFKVGSGNR